MDLQDSGVSGEDHRRMAADLFNFTWTLLNREERTPNEDDAMVHAAHASAYHWMIGDDAMNHSRSHWQCARVYATLGRVEPALWHARRCLELCHEHELGAFDHAIAHEVHARALAVMGERAGAGAALREAREIAMTLDDDEEREVVAADCDEIEAML